MPEPLFRRLDPQDIAEAALDVVAVAWCAFMIAAIFVGVTAGQVRSRIQRHGRRPDA